MYTAFKQWLSRTLVRAGIRLMGIDPDRTVMFTDPAWTNEGIVDWVCGVTGGKPPGEGDGPADLILPSGAATELMRRGAPPGRVIH